MPGWRWSSHSPVCLSPHFSAPLQVTVCWVEEVPASNGQSLSPQAEHAGIRTYFFSAENTEEQESWIQAMGEAARVQIPPTQRSERCTGLGAPPCLLELGWRGRAPRLGTSWSTGSLCRTELGEHQPPEAAGGTGYCWPSWGCYNQRVMFSRVSMPCRHEKTDSENIPPSKHHHHRNAMHREHPKADPDAKTRGEGDGRGSEKMERKPERMEGKKEPLAKANGITGQEMPSEPGSPYPEGPRVPASTERPTQPNGWPYSSPSRPGSTAYPLPDGESAAHRRSFAPRTNPEKIAQRKSSMTQLQQWVNLRRGNVPPEELRR